MATAFSTEVTEHPFTKASIFSIMVDVLKVRPMELK